MYICLGAFARTKRKSIPKSLDIEIQSYMFDDSTYKKHMSITLSTKVI